jgi:ABC transport system ATP-binding/permease protein
VELLLSCQNLGKSLGAQELFQGLSFGIFDRDRLGIIGENGSGKSTLLALLAQELSADQGSISYQKNLRLALVSQQENLPLDLTPLELFEKTAKECSFHNYDSLTEAKIALGKIGIEDPLKKIGEYSGGWQKRMLIGQALLKKPQIVLFDEPTNHLDIEGILWLEQLLQKEKFAFLVVSHDRSFLQKVTNKTLEISKSYLQGFFCVEGGYQKFIEKKQLNLEAQQKKQDNLQKLWKQEYSWLKRSPKARTTKARSRQKDFATLSEDLDSYSNQPDQPKDVSFQGTGRKTKKLAVVKQVYKSYEEKSILKEFNLTLTPGSKWGIVGPNGCGKTTILKLLAKEIAPDQGTIKWADGLKVCYFDQKKQQLPDDQRMKDFLSPAGDHVTYQNQRVHVAGIVRKFCLPEDKLMLPLKFLSGGQKARLLLARLMVQEADILILDEPTNDLDLLSLALLEESLLSFSGAIVLVTHDRSVLEHVCNELVSIDTEGRLVQYTHYSKWEEEFLQKSFSKQKKNKAELPSKKKSLSWKEKNELKVMPDSIEKLEIEISKCQVSIDTLNPESQSQDFQKACKDLQQLHNKQEELFLRWEILEEKQNNF